MMPLMPPPTPVAHWTACHRRLPGIPIIHNMQGSYVGDSIQSVMGIMNGTTNFMLTKMETEGADYAVVLKEAQDLGYAEGERGRCCCALTTRPTLVVMLSWW